jgi:carbonic anhydrase
MNRKMSAASLTILVLVSVALYACAPNSAAVPTQSTHSATSVHWTYEGEEGPAHWGSYDAGSYIELDGVRYDLTQFHFSEGNNRPLQSLNGRMVIQDTTP